MTDLLIDLADIEAEPEPFEPEDLAADYYAANGCAFDGGRD